MKIRVQEENINTKEYLDKWYSDPDWAKDNDGAYVRLKQALELIDQRYHVHLDVGCADGAFTKYYLEKFPKTEGYGMDLSEIIIAKAKANCPEGHFFQGDTYNIPMNNDFFNLVHSAEMLEHLEFPEKAIAEMHRVLKPGGTLIVTTPNKFASDYIEHLWKWDVDGVREMLESKMGPDKLKGFKIIEEHPSFHNGHIMYLKAIKI